MSFLPDPSQEDVSLFDYFFGGIKRSNALHLPNLVIVNKSPSVSVVLDTVGCRGGAWQNEPPYGKDKGPFVTFEHKNHEYFRSWSSEENQQALRALGKIFRLGAFTMLLDVNVPEEVLNWFDEKINNFGYTPLLEEMYPLIAERIEVLRWAYFPLSDEVPIAMFVTVSANRKLIEEIVISLDKSRLSYTQVVNQHGRPSWRLPDDMKRLCRS